MAAEFWETTAEEYRADSSLSQSKIKDFLRDPQQFYRCHVARTEPPKPPTKAMIFGTDVERLAFYGTLPAMVIPVEVMQRRNNADGTVTYAKAGAEWTRWSSAQIAQFGPDMKLLKAEEYADVCGPIMQAVEGLRSHTRAAELMWGGSVRHVRMRWVDEITGLPCKCELDLLHLNNIVADLKTCFDVSTTGFQRQVVRLGYYIQAWFYREALVRISKYIDKQPDCEMARQCLPILERVLANEPPLFCWIAAKNKPSYHTEVHPCENDWYSLAEPIVRQAMAEIKRCYETGRWQTATHGSFTTMKCPKYAYNILEELLPGDE